MSLVKKDLVDELVNKIGLRQNEAADLINDFFDQIKCGLAEKGDVKISGFGNFTLLKKAARMGRNPKTKEAFLISERTVVSFKPGVKFKRLVQERGVLES